MPAEWLEAAGKSVWVTLRSGTRYELEPAGDLGAQNGGLLVFVDGREHAEYAPWSDVRAVDLSVG
jgi:hypothetical protein